jgi:undecaprenyl-diphosphatase
MSADTRLFLTINDFARAAPWSRSIVAACAGCGLVLFAVLLPAGWWPARRRTSPVLVAAALWAPLGMLLAPGMNQPLPAPVGGPRPSTALPDIVILAHRSLDPSFPSDHAVPAGAVTAGLVVAGRWLGGVAAFAAVVMAFCRVYIAGHAAGAAASLVDVLLLHRSPPHCGRPASARADLIVARLLRRQWTGEEPRG